MYYITQLTLYYHKHYISISPQNLEELSRFNCLVELVYKNAQLILKLQSFGSIVLINALSIILVRVFSRLFMLCFPLERTQFCGGFRHTNQPPPIKSATSLKAHLRRIQQSKETFSIRFFMGNRKAQSAKCHGPTFAVFSTRLKCRKGFQRVSDLRQGFCH